MKLYELVEKLSEYRINDDVDIDKLFGIKTLCAGFYENPNVPFKTSAERDQHIKQVLIEKMIPILKDKMTISEFTHKFTETGTVYSCYMGYLKIIEREEQ